MKQTTCRAHRSNPVTQHFVNMLESLGSVPSPTKKEKMDNVNTKVDIFSVLCVEPKTFKLSYIPSFLFFILSSFITQAEFKL